MRPSEPFQTIPHDPNANVIHFMICYGVAFIAAILIAAWYIWPNIKNRAPREALTPLLLYSCLRVNGLMFLMPGLVSPDLPSGFAVPTAYGDLTAVILSLISLFLIRAGSFLALPMVWLFNLAGTLDLLYANFATFKYHVDPADLGASYYLAAINVPVQIIIHVMLFAYLLRADNKPKRQWS
jgi:membrane-associated HD superfamily phosphohydrolase